MKCSRTPSSTHPPFDRNGDAEYIRRTDELNKLYTTEYARWLTGLTPTERRQARELGLDRPIENFHRVSGHAPDQDRDAAESTHSRVEFDTTSIDQDATTPPPAGPMSPDVMHTITRIVGEIIACENVKINVAALAFALNMDVLNGLGSIREYAAKIGVSPEAVSKAKRKWEMLLNLPPNAFAKTAKAKAALSLAQRTKHWKNAKWTALRAPARNQPAA